jgi:hypothetical protein
MFLNLNGRQKEISYYYALLFVIAICWSCNNIIICSDQTNTCMHMMSACFHRFHSKFESPYFSFLSDDSISSPRSELDCAWWMMDPMSKGWHFKKACAVPFWIYAIMSVGAKGNQSQGYVWVWSVSTILSWTRSWLTLAKNDTNECGNYLSDVYIPASAIVAYAWNIWSIRGTGWYHPQCSAGWQIV